jgi:hypothetical protein
MIRHEGEVADLLRKSDPCAPAASGLRQGSLRLPPLCGDLPRNAPLGAPPPNPRRGVWDPPGPPFGNVSVDIFFEATRLNNRTIGSRSEPHSNPQQQRPEPATPSRASGNGPAGFMGVTL